MKETHIIGNQGEAPVDTANDWECLPLDTKLQRLAWDLDDASAQTNYDRLLDGIEAVRKDLETLSQEVFEYCKRNGVTL